MKQEDVLVINNFAFGIFSEEVKEESDKPSVKHSRPAASKKTKVVPKTKGKASVAFTHKWLASSLKGHSARILDMDFSPNGKYVLTVADGNNCFRLFL